MHISGGRLLSEQKTRDRRMAKRLLTQRVNTRNIATKYLPVLNKHNFDREYQIGRVCRVWAGDGREGRGGAKKHLNNSFNELWFIFSIYEHGIILGHLFRFYAPRPPFSRLCFHGLFAYAMDRSTNWTVCVRVCVCSKTGEGIKPNNITHILYYVLYKRQQNIQLYRYLDVYTCVRAR